MKEITVNIHGNLEEALDDAFTLGIATRPGGLIVGVPALTLRGSSLAIDFLLARWGYAPDGSTELIQYSEVEHVA
jgi:hypothetical protein